MSALARATESMTRAAFPWASPTRKFSCASPMRSRASVLMTHAYRPRRPPLRDALALDLPARCAGFALGLATALDLGALRLTGLRFTALPALRRSVPRA